MFFFGFYFDDPKVDRLFDLARVVLEPQFARKSHVTLRGPYKKKPDSSSRWLSENVGTVVISKPRNFFSENQNTVFLRTEIMGIGDYWYKPDYPEGVPHLSLYDGKDRKFAWQILEVLRAYPWGFSLPTTDLKIIDSKQLVETHFLRNFDRFEASLSEIEAQKYSMEDLKGMPIGQRVFLFDRICTRIHEITG
ncbi:MAG: hypothetical protein AAF340_15150 [Pseudomonadota bacterium]